MAISIPLQSTPCHVEDDTRVGLKILVDVLLPGTASLPAGNDVDTIGSLLDRVTTADPALINALTQCAQLAAQRSRLTLTDLQSWDDSAALDSAIFALTAAYYLSADVQRALNYPGLGGQPVSEATPDQTYDEELLAPVRDRGSIYVPSPE